MIPPKITTLRTIEGTLITTTENENGKTEALIDEKWYAVPENLIEKVRHLNGRHVVFVQRDDKIYTIHEMDEAKPKQADELFAMSKPITTPAGPQPGYTNPTGYNPEAINEIKIKEYSGQFEIEVSGKTPQDVLQCFIKVRKEILSGLSAQD